MDPKRLEENDLARQLIREFEQVSGQRTNFDSHWDEIAARMWPALSGTFTGSRAAGDKRNSEVYDSTAAIALNRFGSIVDSLLTPRNSMWHRLTVSDPVLAKNRDVKLYFEDVTRILFRHRYAPKANFASQNQSNYKALGAFGTGCVFADRLAGREKGIRYKAMHLRNVFFCENHQGLVDTCYRRFKLNPKQAKQQFGEENLPDAIKKAPEKNADQQFEFLHIVKPRENYDPERIDAKGMPFAAYYVSVTGGVLLEESGYSTFPYAISRYEQGLDEVYGRSPAMDVLPAVKVLNEQKKTVLTAGHRTVNPIYLGHDDGIADIFSAVPGTMVAGGVSADGRPLVHTLPTGRVDIGKELMDDERSVINDAFLVTIFQILTETPAMTATEVLERTKEKGILLAPTIGRQQSEYLGPLIERELDLLAQMRLLPPMPQALVEAAGEYRIEYDSPLSRAQRAEEAAGLMRTIEVALQVVNITQNPEPLDHFDWDVIIPEVSEIQAVPARWMKSMEKVVAIRQGRAQQAQEQTAIQAAPGAAAMLKAVNQTPKARTA